VRACPTDIRHGAGSLVRWSRINSLELEPLGILNILNFTKAKPNDRRRSGNSY
jgi:hypothetical protein